MSVLTTIGWVLLALAAMSEKMFKNKDTGSLVSFVLAVMAFTLFTYGLIDLIF